MSKDESLNELLFCWLHSPNEKISNTRFSKLYSALEGKLHHSLRRKYGNTLDESSIEDVLQETFSYCINKFSVKRPEVARFIAAQLSNLNSPRLQTWSVKLLQWQREAMAFGKPPQQPDFPWEQEIRAINKRLSPLRNEGTALLTQEPKDADIVQAVVENSAKVIVPGIAMFFWKMNKEALSQIDHQKQPMNTTDYSVDDLPLSDFEEDDEQDYEAFLAFDYDHHHDDKDIFQDIYKSLSALVEKAEIAHTQARTPFEQKKTAKRLADEWHDYTLRIDIIELTRKGCTQEQIAEKLKLSRDQIRYQLEKIINLTNSLRNKG